MPDRPFNLRHRHVSPTGTSDGYHEHPGGDKPHTHDAEGGNVTLDPNEMTPEERRIETMRLAGEVSRAITGVTLAKNRLSRVRKEQGEWNTALSRMMFDRKAAADARRRQLKEDAT